jgi:dTMP kinase
MTASARYKGKFITVEGVEGVGKSTHMNFIATYLRDRDQTVVTTREPGGTAVAEQIREVLLHSSKGALSDVCELLLMFAARASHLQEVIIPALERGDWVVCDRFTDASYAYQGGGRGLPDESIEQLEALVQDSLEPDLTLLLDASPQITAARRRDRGGVTDRFEAEQADFFARVQAKYRELAARHPERIKIIDASGDLEAVERQVAAELDSLINVI